MIINEIGSSVLYQESMNHFQTTLGHYNRKYCNVNNWLDKFEGLITLILQFILIYRIKLARIKTSFSQLCSEFQFKKQKFSEKYNTSQPIVNVTMYCTRWPPVSPKNDIRVFSLPLDGSMTFKSHCWKYMAISGDAWSRLL